MQTLAELASQISSSIAVLGDGLCLTYRELYERCRNLDPLLDECASLGSRLRKRTPAVVAFEANNDLPTVVLIHGLLERGLTALPLNPRLTKNEQAYLVKLAGATLLGRASNGFYVAQTDACAPTAARGATTPSSFHASFTEGPLGSASAPSIATDRQNCPALLIATSGSTGNPKLVRLSRRALEASAKANARHLEMTPNDRWLLSLSLSHIGGYSILFRSLYCGSAIVLCDPANGVEELTECANRYDVTLISLVPTQLKRILALPSREALRHLRAALIGGAPCPPSLLAKARHESIPALATFGMSEAAAQMATQPLSDLLAREPQGDSGVALCGVELRLESGVLGVRGETLFDGYVSSTDPESVERPFDDHGWFITGDLGELTSEGRFMALGRRSDRIVTGGENVSPAEVEAAITALAGVVDAVVVGLPDAEWGQVVAAAVVCDGDWSRSNDWYIELAAQLRENIARYKCPKRWLRLQELPRLASGKLDRAQVARSFDPA